MSAPTKDQIDDHLFQDEDDGEWPNCGGEGFIDGDCTCGEDCCCCAEPDPPMCIECQGAGYLMPSQSAAIHPAKENETK